jgi:hypothetical protein
MKEIELEDRNKQIKYDQDQMENDKKVMKMNIPKTQVKSQKMKKLKILINNLWIYKLMITRRLHIEVRTQNSQIDLRKLDKSIRFQINSVKNLKKNLPSFYTITHSNMSAKDLHRINKKVNKANKNRLNEKLSLRKKALMILRPLIYQRTLPK